MKIVLITEYIVNFILMSIFYMHMFQLNSYTYERQLRWMKENLKKVILHSVTLIVSVILILLNNGFMNLISAILLATLIIYNIPKNKSKISFKYTKRVLRMFCTQSLLSAIILLIAGVNTNILLKLGIITLLSIVMCMVVNFINSPIEKMCRKSYINKAKKILAGMKNLIVIGVTGSYGKTSVKNYLYKVLSGKYEVLVTPLNYNTPMGVVKTIREYLKPTHQIFICEMGAYKLGEIKEICDIVNPTIGIITSIGPQHLETFGSIENVLKTKFELYDAVKKNGGKVFLNYDNEHIRNMKDVENYITYGVENSEVDFNAYNLKSSSDGLKFVVKDSNINEEIEFETELIGKHNIVNLAGAIAVGNYLDISLKDIVSRIRKIKSVEHRLQLLPGEKISIIDDSYNSNPVSSKSALDTLAEFEGTKIIVTPGLIELGKEEDKFNFELGKYMINKTDYIFLVGEKNSKSLLEGIKSTEFDESKVFLVKSPEEAMKKITSLNIPGKITVLLENDLPDNYN